MPVLSETAGYVLIAVFGLAMIAVTWVVSREDKWRSSGGGFLVAGRNVNWFFGATSIAASWIWAPALFVSVQKTYELGIPGILWFTVPNVLALVIFSWLAPEIRRRLPGGYTLPDWMRYRFKSKLVHRVYLVPYIWYQIMAVCVQLFVGGLMLNFLTGIDLNVVMFAMLAIGLTYSLISGLRASVVTDFIQLLFIGLGLIIIIPWFVSRVGWQTVEAGFGGLAGKTNPFDPEVAVTFGIVTSIGLIAGAISDQQYWQRSFAIKREHLRRAFFVGGLMFGIVPLALSVLGFVAANPSANVVAPEGQGLPMIGIAAVVAFLPTAAVVFFVVMLLAGLTSTLDSALCAASSLYAVDFGALTEEERAALHEVEHDHAGDLTTHALLNAEIMKRARVGMFGLAIIGLGTAYVVQHLFSLDRLWWIFNGFASCFVVPTILSVFWRRLTAKGVVGSIIASLLGMIVFVYGNWVGSVAITVGSAVFIVVAGFLMCYVFRARTQGLPLEEVS